MFVSGFLDLFGRSTCHMSTRLSSSSTLMEGMEAVKFEGGRSDRKRELEELIKASHLNFIALSMPQVLNDYILIDFVPRQRKNVWKYCGESFPTSPH